MTVIGGPTSAVIALKNPQISVTVVDKNEDIIKAWNSQYPPIYEPGLPAIIEATRISPASPGQEIDTSFGSYHKAKHDRTENGAGSPTHDQKNAIRNLQFSTDIDQAIIDAEIILISVDTPTKTEGKGRNFAADISAVEQVARHIAKVSNGYKIVVEKSTVPCKTAESIRDIVSHSLKVEFVADSI
jgi:UDPglucose 6-dehydrogenase